MPKKSNPQSNCFSNDSGRQKRLENMIAQTSSGRPFCTVWVKDNVNPASCDPRFGIQPTRCLVIFEGLPVSTECLEAWRAWASEEGVIDLKMAFVKPDFTEGELVELVRKRCSSWLTPIPPPEHPEVCMGKWVHLPESPKKYDPALLTMMFGSMGELLTRMDLIARRFRSACRLQCGQEEYKTAIAKMLRAGSGDSATLPKLGVPIERLPRVLLLGETGVGKTLFARYLAGEEESFRRVSIPEYLGKEDMFEYDLFGYARGAYTDGKEHGDIGQLLDIVGGVVFLDEIGTASPTIQKKLLAYLDDYCVRPRGWSAGPFQCPALVVAATNRPLEELQDPAEFRPDLLARFTDIEEVPPLRKRMDDLPFILDCLLQNLDINPTGNVTDIGCEAFMAIRKHEFKANFRELENVLRKACESASREGRNYLCTPDLKL